jgi:hypothetical protein
MDVSNVFHINKNPCVPPEMAADVRKLDSGILEAIKEAKWSGVPQGFVVAILHGYAQRETLEMLQ